MHIFPSEWQSLIETHTPSSSAFALKPMLDAIQQRIAADEAAGKRVLPIESLRFRALETVSPACCTCVLLGQDPYHGISKNAQGQMIEEATGLAFSVPPGIRVPPSLRNIQKELFSDTGEHLAGGDLSHWAEQGVLMLNTCLSVVQDHPKSHDKIGWQMLTNALIAGLSRYRSELVFILWGNNAKSMAPLIAENGHTIIESSHPSPIGGSCNKGFFGSKPFSRANAALARAGRPTIRWGSDGLF